MQSRVSVLKIMYIIIIEEYNYKIIIKVTSKIDNNTYFQIKFSCQNYIHCHTEEIVVMMWIYF